MTLNYTIEQEQHQVQAPTLPLETRVCSGPCGLEKPITSFDWDGHGRRQRMCGACRSEARRFNGRRCVQCPKPLPAARNTPAYTTCSRACLLESIGLPPTFDALLDLDKATEREVRDVLGAVLLAVRGQRPAK